MTTFADILKKEIARVARKELQEEISALRKASGLQRAEIALLRKQVKVLSDQIKKLGKSVSVPTPQLLNRQTSLTVKTAKGRPGRKVVFTPDRLKAQRARLGLTQEQMATLLGVSSLSVWKWESGAAVPRTSRIPQILERLALGKKEALSKITKDGHEQKHL